MNETTEVVYLRINPFYGLDDADFALALEATKRAAKLKGDVPYVKA